VVRDTSSIWPLKFKSVKSAWTIQCLPREGLWSCEISWFCRVGNRLRNVLCATSSMQREAAGFAPFPRVLLCTTWLGRVGVLILFLTNRHQMMQYDASMEKEPVKATRGRTSNSSSPHLAACLPQCHLAKRLGMRREGYLLRLPPKSICLLTQPEKKRLTECL